MLSTWWRTLAYLLGLLLFCLVLWPLFGAVTALIALCAGLALELGFHLRQLRRFEVWLGSPSEPLPSARGLWGDVLYRLENLLKSQRAAQQYRDANHEQMRLVAQLLPDGVVLIDAQQRIVWFNQAAEAQLGLKGKRDIGQFISYILRNAAFNAWLTSTSDGPLTMPAPTDASRSLTLRRVPMPDAQQMLFCHDITDQVRLDAMRRDFIANVSHELRTPITVIAGFLESFADMPEPDAQRFKDYLKLMREQSDRIRRLLDDLLTLARLEADTEVVVEPVDVAALARSLLQEAQSLSGGRHKVVLELKSDARIAGNAKEIHSALSNLVSNAVRYTPSGGQITLRWSTNATGGAEFSVADTGEGIEPQHIPRLTERFYRVDRGRSRATGGTGLGLAIVKHVLQRHQARLRIESTVGKGSTFTAVFPPERIIPAATESPQSPGQAAA